MVRTLIEAGADTHILTEDGETPQDLVESDDLETMAALLGTNIEKLRQKISVRLGKVGPVKSEPAWVRKESTQEELEKKKMDIVFMTGWPEDSYTADFFDVVITSFGKVLLTPSF